MVVSDYRLAGRQICLRGSMDKFDASHSLDLEISNTFDYPGKMQLNRYDTFERVFMAKQKKNLLIMSLSPISPLIMLLDSSGVESDQFLRLQRKAVEETGTALKSVRHTAKLLVCWDYVNLVLVRSFINCQMYTHRSPTITWAILFASLVYYRTSKIASCLALPTFPTSSGVSPDSSSGWLKWLDRTF